MKKIILAICAILLLCGCEIRELDEAKTNSLVINESDK